MSTYAISVISCLLTGTALPALADVKSFAAPGHSPQPEVIIPDSEESPERRAQRQAPPCASPSLNGPPAAAGCAPRLCRSPPSQQGLARRAAGLQTSSSGQSLSGCSLEALPGHSQPDVCTGAAAADRLMGHPAWGTGHSSELRAAQPGPNVLTMQQRPGAAALGEATALGTAHPPVKSSSIWSGLDSHTRCGLAKALTHAPSRAATPQHVEDCLPAFGTPIAPAPAGPCEHLGDHEAGQQPHEAMQSNEDGQRLGQGSAEVQDRRVRDAAQHPKGTHQLEGSQPSSSSLKRVPETPDSAENRSQPTQSPCGELTDASCVTLHCPLRTGCLSHEQCCIISNKTVMSQYPGHWEATNHTL